MQVRFEMHGETANFGFDWIRPSNGLPYPEKTLLRILTLSRTIHGIGEWNRFFFIRQIAFKLKSTSNSSQGQAPCKNDQSQEQLSRF